MGSLGKALNPLNHLKATKKLIQKTDPVMGKLLGGGSGNSAKAQALQASGAEPNIAGDPSMAPPPDQGGGLMGALRNFRQQGKQAWKDDSWSNAGGGGSGLMMGPGQTMKSNPILAGMQGAAQALQAQQGAAPPPAAAPPPQMAPAQEPAPPQPPAGQMSPQMQMPQMPPQGGVMPPQIPGMGAGELSAAAKINALRGGRRMRGM